MTKIVARLQARVRLLFVAFFFCTGPIAYAAAGCALEEINSNLPQAVPAIERWQIAQQTKLSRGAKQLVLDSICDAASRLLSQGVADLSDIDAALPPVVSKYLDENLRGGTKVTSLADGLINEFSLGSTASLPEVKYLGAIVVIYEHHVDALIINDTTFPPFSRFLAELGPVTVRGVLKNQEICRAVLNVNPVDVEKIRC